MRPAFIVLMVTVTSVALLGFRDDMYQQAQKYVHSNSARPTQMLKICTLQSPLADLLNCV